MSHRRISVIRDLWTSYQQKPSMAVLVHVMLAINFFLNDIVKVAQENLDELEGYMPSEKLEPLLTPLLESAGHANLPTSVALDRALADHGLATLFTTGQLQVYGLRSSVFTTAFDMLCHEGKMTKVSCPLSEDSKAITQKLNDLKTNFPELKKENDQKDNARELTDNQKIAQDYLRLKKLKKISIKQKISTFFGRIHPGNRKKAKPKIKSAQKRSEIVGCALSLQWLQQEGAFASLSKDFKESLTPEQVSQYSRQVIFGFFSEKIAMQLPSEQGVPYQKWIRQLCELVLIRDLSNLKLVRAKGQSSLRDFFDFETPRRGILSILSKRFNVSEESLEKDLDENFHGMIREKSEDEKRVLSELNQMRKRLKSIPDQIFTSANFQCARLQINYLITTLADSEVKSALSKEDSFWRSPVRCLAWYLAVIVHVFSTKSLVLLSYSEYVIRRSDYKPDLQEEIEKTVDMLGLIVPLGATGNSSVDTSEHNSVVGVANSN